MNIWVFISDDYCVLHAASCIFTLKLLHYRPCPSWGWLQYVTLSQETTCLDKAVFCSICVRTYRAFSIFWLLVLCFYLQLCPLQNVNECCVCLFLSENGTIFVFGIPLQHSYVELFNIFPALCLLWGVKIVTIFFCKQLNILHYLSGGRLVNYKRFMFWMPTVCLCGFFQYYFISLLLKCKNCNNFVLGTMKHFVVA